MATYYVRKSGSDSNAGTSTGAAWLTVDKAASTAVAGDTVYIGAGVYYETVTNDNSGSSGSPIRFIADVTGAYTGDAGLVIISAFGSQNSDHANAATRSNCWVLNGKTWVEITGFVMVGTKDSGGRVFTSAAAGNHSFEGVVIEQCAFISMGVDILSYNGYCLGLDLGNGATPSGSTGLTIRQCAFWGRQGIALTHTNNATAHENLKMVIENCVFWGEFSSTGIIIWNQSTSNTYSIGGILIRSCTFVGHTQGVYLRYGKNLVNPVEVYNCVFASTEYYCLLQELGTTGSLVDNYNRVVNSTTNAWYGVDRGGASTFNGLWIPGFMVDHILRINWGWSQFSLMESINLSGYTDLTIDAGATITNALATSNDLNGNPRRMGRPQVSQIYYMDASDDAVSDPNGVWTNEANTVDSSITTVGFTSSAGSSSSNYVFAGGTNAPSSGETPSAVKVRVNAKHDSGTNSSSVVIYTDGLAESLGTVTITNAGTLAWTSWTSLSTPSGGWTWAKIQALEFKGWKDSGSSYINIAQVQIGVITSVSPDIGAVESNPQPTQNSTDEYEGTYCMEMNGTSQYTFWQPVSAASTTISVQVKFDANYTGTKPQLVITNIPGVADQTDTATGSAGSYEQLSLNFTPTSAGFVRVKLVSNDTSATGKCFFDDIQVS